MGETELIAALKQGGPWAVVLGVMWILWRRDFNAMFSRLLAVVEANTAAFTKLAEKLDRVLEDRRP